MQIFIKGIRSIFAWLDIIVYGAIEIIYNLFMEIAQTNIFSSEINEKFGMRIYALLGIIMLFKLSFSLINYMINPSQMNDKSKGGGKLVTNILIVLLLIVTTPFLFEAAFDLQHIILSENTVGKIILGTGGSEGLNVGAQERAGRIMSFDVFLAFYKPDSTIIDCQEDYLVKDEFNRIVLTEACRNALNGIDESIGAGKAYDKAVKNSSIKILTESKLLHLTKPGSDTFAFDYNAVLSTIAGGFVAWIMLIFCIDIAVRSVKLGFYQLIAPIPIISYIDPDSSKNGFFQKWLKNTASTFLDVFIRLAAIYFVIFIISNLDQMEVWKDGTMQRQTDLLVRVFVILGALLFAKQLPQILQDLTGMKLDGGFSLNPMKKLGASPFASAAIGGMIGAGAGALGSFAANRALGKGVGRSVAGGLGGIFSGGARGVMGGFGAGGKGSPLKIGMDSGSKSAANVLSRSGTTFGSRASARMATAFGLDTTADKQDYLVKQYEEYMKFKEQIDTRAEKELIKQPGRKVTFEWTAVNGTRFRSTGNLQVLKNQIETLKSTPGATAEDITNATTAYNMALRQAKTDYVNEKLSATSSADRDYVIDSLVEQMDRIVERNKESGSGAFAGVDVSITKPDTASGETHYGNLDSINKILERDKTTLKSSDEWIVAHASKENFSRKK